MAIEHYRHTLLRRCFIAWQIYLTKEQNERLLNEVQCKTKNKMAAFLDAAASGKLWSEKGEESPNLPAEGTDSARQKVVCVLLKFCEMCCFQDNCTRY